jgi:hypothetical protein
MKIFFVFLLSGVFLLLPATAPLFAQPAAESLVDNECSKCHNLKRVYSANKKAGDWEKTVDRMIKKGAKIKPEEKDAVIKYLNTLNK